MSNKEKNIYSGSKRFTALEIIIIVVAFGFISSVVMPKLSMAAGEAQTSQLCDGLYNVRTAISLYKMQHKGELPGLGSADFVRALTSKTNEDGNVCSVDKIKDISSLCGPYINEIPSNPFNNLNTVRIDGPSAGQGTHGWRYSSFTGEFQADDINVGHDIL